MNSKTGFIAPGGMSKTTVALPEEGSKTRVELPGDMGNDAPPTTTSATVGDPPAKAAEASAQPVVGWVIIIDGSGKGQSFELTFGMNPIGRNASNKVALDFGDDLISGDDHFSIAYDDRNRNFLIAARSGRNLVYIGDDPIIDSRTLESGTELTVGNTTLKFVALCTKEWTWG